MQNAKKTPIIHEEVAALLGIKRTTLYNRISAGVDLPPSYHPPGCARRVWFYEEVIEWLQQYKVDPRQTAHEQPPIQANEVCTQPTVQLSRGRGRPRKVAGGGVK